MQRYYSISSLRAVGILLMVQVHFGWYLALPSSQQQFLYDLMTFLGEFAPPLFFFTLGISLVLSVAKRNEKALVHIARRAFGLILIGLILIPFWQGSILHFLGIHTLLAYATMKFHWCARLLVALIILAATPSVLEYWDYMAGWERLGYKLDDFWTVKGFVRNFFVSGFFPMFPWIVFPLLGTVVGEFLLEKRQKEEKLRLYLYCKMSGIFFLALGLSLNVFTPIDLTFYPPSISYVLLFLGFSLTTFAVFFWLFDMRKMCIDWFRPLFFLGDVTLSIYILHIVLGLKVFGALQLYNSLSMTMVFLAIAGMLLVFWTVCMISVRFTGKGPFEYLFQRMFLGAGY